MKVLVYENSRSTVKFRPRDTPHHSRYIVIWLTYSTNSINTEYEKYSFKFNRGAACGYIRIIAQYTL
jgi:hypothetical protein